MTDFDKKELGLRALLIQKDTKHGDFLDGIVHRLRALLIQKDTKRLRRRLIIAYV